MHKMSKERPTIDELEEFFATAEIKWLSDCERIKAANKFIKSHLEYLKSNSGNKAYMPYYDRLVKIKKILET